MITTKLLKNTGVLKAALINPEVKISKIDDFGQYSPATLLSGEIATYTFSIEIYNPSETLRTVKNFKAEFYDHGNDSTLTSALKDDAETIFTGTFNRYYDSNYYNIGPKEFKKIDFLMSFSKLELTALANSFRTDIEFLTLKNNSLKTKKRKFKDVKFTEIKE